MGWDEVAEIRADSGPPRHGVVLEIRGDVAVVQVFEGTGGLRLDDARVTFSGAPLRVPVGEGWLGRVCNGLGDPIDGGPPVVGAEVRPVGGRPINPAAREAPSEPIVTGVSAIDGLATLVRGQKASHLLGRRAPPPRARSAGGGPGARGCVRRAVRRRLRGHGHHPRGCGNGEARPRGADRGGRSGADPERCRRPARRAHPHPADRAHRRRAPRLRPRSARPRRNGRRDELLRGRA